jgi:hypothetical protein
MVQLLAETGAEADVIPFVKGWSVARPLALLLHAIAV